MDYVNLGRSGLKVSRLCLGCMSYGDTSCGWHGDWVLDQDQSRPFIREAIEAGINFFDTAQAYQVDGDRCSERMLGVALQGRRKEAVIASKFGLHAGEDQTVFDGAMITAAIDETLEALQTEYLDLMQVQ